MQPGMPQGSGACGRTPIITLPGNPVSALVSFEVFIRPAAAGGDGAAAPRPTPGRRPTLLEDLTSPRGKRQFRRGVLDHDGGTVTSYGPPASHHLRWLASANCLSGDRRGRRRTGGGSPVRVWDLTRDTRRIGTPWPDPRDPPMPPTSPRSPDLVELVRSTVPPVHPAGLPFIAGGLGTGRRRSQAPVAAQRGPVSPPGPAPLFFRHPPRVPPTRPGVVVAPADGLGHA